LFGYAKNPRLRKKKGNRLSRFLSIDRKLYRGNPDSGKHIAIPVYIIYADKDLLHSAIEVLQKNGIRIDSASIIGEAHASGIAFQMDPIAFKHRESHID
jgi:hypothetical protein